MKRLLTIALTLPVLALAAGSGHAQEKPTAATDTELEGAVLQSKVYFQFDKAELSDRAKAELDEAAQWSFENPDSYLVIEGHADKVGTPAYNKQLSDERAAATKAYLVEAGVVPARIRIVPYGESLPAVPTDDKERANRRITMYSVHSDPIVKKEKEKEIAVVPVESEPDIVTVTETKTEKVAVPVERDMTYSLTAGGGVLDSIESDTRSMTNVGGMWNVRFAAGQRALVGSEVAYLGSAQNLENEVGLGDDATMLGNGVEGAVKLGLPESDIRPYAFAGVGYAHYNIVETDPDLEDLDDNVVFIPAGVGISYQLDELMIDVRGTARAAFDDELLTQMSGADDDGLDNWSASAQVGYAF